MKRFVNGIILVSFSAMSIAGMYTSRDRPPTLVASTVVGLMMGATGAAMIYYGQRALARHDRVMTAAFNQVRRQNYLDTRVLAMNGGTTEMEVRRIVLREQMRGLLAMNVNWQPPAPELPASASAGT